MPGGAILIGPDGTEEFVYEDELKAKLATPGYSFRDSEVTISEGDRAARYSTEHVPELLERNDASFTSYGEQERIADDNAREAAYGGAIDKVAAGGLGVARGLSLGGSDWLAKKAGADLDYIRGVRDENPITSMVGEVGGSILPGLTGIGAVGSAANAGRAARLLAKAPMGIAERVALRASGGVKGLRAAAVREGVAGAAIGAGTAVSELALSEDPVTLEGAVSNVSSSMLYGGVLGAGGSVFGKAAEKGLIRVKNSLAERAAAKAGGEVSEGAKFVAATRQFRDDIQAAGNLFHVTGKAEKGSKLLKAGGRHKTALRQMDKLLDTEEILAHSPYKIREALMRQRKTLEEIIEEAPALRVKFVADGAKEGGRRLSTLDAVPEFLERNRALSATLEELDQAGRLARQPKPEGIVEQSVKGVTFGKTMAAATALGVPGALAVPASAVLSRKLSGMLFGRLDKAAGATEQRIAAAMERFLGTASKRVRTVAPAATKVLTSARFSPALDDPHRPQKAATALGKAFLERAREIRSMVTVGNDGRHRMTRSSRYAMAGTWDSVRINHPKMADSLEQMAADRIQFLADRLPTNPGVPTDMLGGPDSWAPSSADMRKFARFVAAAEDPAGVVERMATTRMTTEDAETLRELYPETFAAIQMDLISRLPHLRKKLPYKKRLMLSIFTGVPIEPSFNPRVLRTLQSHFEQEAGSEGGTQAPRPEPAFGSMSRPEPTPAQSHG